MTMRRLLRELGTWSLLAALLAGVGAFAWATRHPDAAGARAGRRSAGGGSLGRRLPAALRTPGSTADVRPRSGRRPGGARGGGAPDPAARAAR